MSDIVERLRRWEKHEVVGGDCFDGANEIERLRADRDSWADQADARVKDCVEYISEIERLRGFVDEAFQVWPYGDWNGGALQDALVRHGLVALKYPPPREPCGPDCLCAESYLADEFAGGDVECYQRVR